MAARTIAVWVAGATVAGASLFGTACSLTDEATCEDFLSYDAAKKREAAAEVFGDSPAGEGFDDALASSQVASLQSYCTANPDDPLDELEPTGF